MRLYLDGQEFGTMERWRAMTSAHEGAVYLHRGASFVVTELDLENLRAELVPLDVNYYTQSMVQSTLEVNVDVRSRELTTSCSMYLSGVTVTDVVAGYHGVVEAVVPKTWVRVDAGICKAGVFIAPEREDSLVHLLGIENLEPHEQVKVLDRETGDCKE